jgi:hypothetical protein
MKQSGVTTYYREVVGHATAEKNLLVQKHWTNCTVTIYQFCLRDINMKTAAVYRTSD